MPLSCLNFTNFLNIISSGFILLQLTINQGWQFILFIQTCKFYLLVIIVLEFTYFPIFWLGFIFQTVIILTKPSSSSFCSLHTSCTIRTP
uniref:Uncharacterized protein n=1 Tax=Gossypium raimondii TaxID=29730 RepID=A0A0D2S208_GOSRA|nr:hypothetical protein B456_006G123600 [Gossypium raimondii]